MWIRFKDNVLMDFSKFVSIIISEQHDPRGNFECWRMVGRTSYGYDPILETYKTKEEALSDLTMLENKLREKSE